jgi:hypothetical protein
MAILQTPSTSLTGEIAIKSGITLIFYGHGEHLMIGTHPDRILIPSRDDKIFCEAK